MAGDDGNLLLELAGRLARGADAIHARLVKDIAEGRIDRPAAQRLFQDESVLRQWADALCIQAAGSALPALREDQARLLRTVDAASARIQQAQDISRVVALAADLLVLAAAVGAAKAGLVAAALRNLARDTGGEDAS